MMTSTERLYRLFARSYPSEHCDDFGDEQVVTALELSDGRFSLMEAVALLAGGLRCRARRSLARDRDDLLISALRIGVFLLLAEGVRMWLHSMYYWDGDSTMWWQLALGCLGPALMLFSTGRRAAVAQTVAMVILYGDAIVNDAMPLRFLSLGACVVGALGWIALRSDGRPVMRPTPALALFGLITGGTILTAQAPSSFVFISTPLALVIALFAVALLVAAADPRLAAGAAVFLALNAAGAGLSWSTYRGSVPVDQVLRSLGTGLVAVTALMIASRIGLRRLRQA